MEGNQIVRHLALIFAIVFYSGRQSELAAFMRMGDSRAALMYPGRDTPTSRARQLALSPYDPNEDDPLDHTGSVKSTVHSQYIVSSRNGQPSHVRQTNSSPLLDNIPRPQDSSPRDYQNRQLAPSHDANQLEGSQSHDSQQSY